MNGLERTILGGFSALLPIASNLYFNWADPTATPQKFIVQGSVLFFAGCLIAYLHDNEHNRVKVLQIGLAIPSLLLSIQNGVADKERLDKSQAEKEINNHASIQHKEIIDNPFYFSLFSPANAQSPRTTKKTYKFTLPEQTIGQTVWQGVTGNGPENVWYVIASSHKDKNEAFKKADEINKSNKGLRAVVYDRYQGNPGYTVVVGSGLTLEKAKELHTKVKESGLSDGAYVWSLK